MIKKLRDNSVVVRIKKLNISPWFVIICILALFQFFISIRWSMIDKSPIRWDESGYMLQATITYKTLVQKGVFAFIHQLFNYDRGRADLVILLVQPFFSLLGIRTFSAMVCLNICWFVIAFSLYGIGKEIINDSIGKMIGVLAFLFFGFYQFTVSLAHSFLVEFFLVTVVILHYYFLLIFYRTKLIKYSYFIGITIGLGLMIKVTFIAFTLPCLFLFYGIFKHYASKRIFIKKVVPIIIVPLILAGPYYLYNLKYIIKSTLFLSSSNLADLYGFGEVFNIKTILDYWKGIFIEPTLLPITFIAIIIFILSVKNLFNSTSRHKFCVAVMFTWFIVPVALSTFGTIKDPRYLYPALIPLFLAASVGFSQLIRKSKIVGVTLILLICIVPVYQFSFSNGLITKIGLNIDNYITFQPAPDKREWKIEESVQKINQNLDEKKEVVLLGGNQNYHLNLFRLNGVKQDININYSTIPYYNNSLTYDEAIKYIKDLKPSGILYKTGENWPEFQNKYSKEIIEELSSDSNYEKIDLNITQPDGSQLYMFVPKVKNTFIEKDFNLPISDESNMKSNIDLFEMVDQSNGDFLHLIGWGIVNDKNSIENKIYVVLKSEDNVVVFNTKQMIRTDITKAFGSEFNRNFDNSGFEVSIPNRVLTAGRYRIGVCITNGDKKYLNFTNTYVTKNNDEIFNGFISEVRDLNEYDDTNRIKFSIESIKNNKFANEKVVDLSGFAFVEDSDNLKNKIFIALKSDEQELFFDTGFIKRPDVTKAFEGSININDCGFQAFIPTKLLENKDYKVGILIENEGNGYLQYSDQKIDIKK